MMRSCQTQRPIYRHIVFALAYLAVPVASTLGLPLESATASRPAAHKGHHLLRVRERWMRFLCFPCACGCRGAMAGMFYPDLSDTGCFRKREMGGDEDCSECG